MEKMQLYNAFREVPDGAQKKIGGGRLRGFTDINPMWRFKVLTEQFGPVGFGWRYTIERQWLESSPSGAEVCAFVNINLFVNIDGTWSEGIPGTGGSMFAAKESEKTHVSDECYKMALTDAISVSCKALGVGADIYWGADDTKYSANKSDSPTATKAAAETETTTATPNQIVVLRKLMTADRIDKMLTRYHIEKIEDLPRATASSVIKKLQKEGDSD